MTKDIYRDLKLPRPEQLSFIDYLTNDTFKTITPKVVLNKFHSLRINGNKAAHGELSKPDKALFLLQEAFDLARWLYVQFEKGDPQSIQAFQKPQLIEQGDSKAELKKQKKQALEKLAIQEARMESLLQELEEVRQKAETAQQNSEELQALLQTSQQSADRLEFNEAETRQRIIDLALAEVDWKIGQEIKAPTKLEEVEVPDQPTDSGIGYADYVLWNDDHNPLAVIEAKRTSQSLKEVDIKQNLC